MYIPHPDFQEDELGAIPSAIEKIDGRPDERDALRTVWTNLQAAKERLDSAVALLPEELGAVESEQRLPARAALVSSFGTMSALTVGQVHQQFQNLGASAQGVFQRVINWFISHLANVLNAAAGHLNVSSWSIEASGGFPSGVNIGITVTFA